MAGEGDKMRRVTSMTLTLIALVAFSAPTGTSLWAVNQAKYIAYYFHATQRCVTCRKIESLSREAVLNSFAHEIKNGTLIFKTVNIDEPQNRHFVQDFKLYTKSLVIAKVSGDKTEQFRNLPKIWELVYSPANFTQYVKIEISSFMGGK
jgi:hypothetical protein